MNKTFDRLLISTKEPSMRKQRSRTLHLVSLILTLAGLMSGVTLMPGTARLVSAQVTAPSWSYTGSLNTAREFHTATMLRNGKVLVAGGSDSVLNSAELYDPAT